jgi:hypothetical protein
MRFAPFFAVVGIAFAPCTAMAAPPAPASAPTPPAPSGEVQVPADQGLTITLPDGVVVAFEPGSTGRWGGAGKLASETAKWTRGFHLDLTEGEMDVTMPAAPKGEHAFLVSTRAGTLTEWRGRMHVTVHGDATAVAVYEGAVVVGSNKQSFAINDAGAVVLHKGGDADKARAVPAVPSWDGAAGGPPSFAVAPEGGDATVGLAWGAVAGAASYRVQIATDATMSQIVRHAGVTEPRFAVPGVGLHDWAQVRPVGADGIVGPWSAPRALRVLHYRLPAGAFVARDGVVVLPGGATLPLSDAEGVEVAYENVRPGPPPTTPPVLYWTKLGGPLRSVDDVPLRVAHLRDPGQGVDARVILGHRQIRADVDMQPKQARAGDPIAVRAVVSDPSGRVDLTTEKVTVGALVDLEPVAVDWQHAGNVWTGRIGPRRDRGPSVVRVVVRDGLGQEIGRGFVEIGAASSNGR